MEPEQKRMVAVIGAGPAGLYAARQLANSGYEIVLFNRDIKPGGLAEYGIYVDKHRLKEGMRSQFRSILTTPNIHYLGNIQVGVGKDLTLEEIQAMGFDAILVTVGAQANKRLNLPGDNLPSVFHASQLVYQYNHLPPFSSRTLPIGERVIIIGAGNVMMDISHYLIDHSPAKSVTIVVRRGPGEIKFDQKELESVASNINPHALQSELDRIATEMKTLGQDPALFFSFYQASLAAAKPHESTTEVNIRFLSSPVRILSDGAGKVVSLEVELNKLVSESGQVKPVGTGKTETIPADTVIFAIGDEVEPSLGLPMENKHFALNPNPSFPVNEISYEAYDPIRSAPLPGIFLAGWARQASVGVVGIAKRDGLNAAQAITCYLNTITSPSYEKTNELINSLSQRFPQLVTYSDVLKIAEEERKKALEENIEEYKFNTNQEMLSIIHKA